MLKKVFILPQFGPPFPWANEYLAHVGTLAPYGWHWKILTPHAYSVTSSNVEIMPMSFAEFDARVTATTGVETGNFIDATGLPATSGRMIIVTSTVCSVSTATKNASTSYIALCRTGRTCSATTVVHCSASTSCTSTC